MPPTIIRDLSDTSGYWAAVWTMCPMPDVHVICDAPVGCFNLVATAVPDYTDSIPHIENIAPATMTETEVGGKGTAEKVRWTYDNLRDQGAINGKRVIVVSTAESEMIGSDLSDLVQQLGTGTTFYYSNSLAEDEWAGRDRVLRWLYEQYGHRDTAIDVIPGTVNIIGPTYGCFNSPSDLAELKRLILGAGGTINLVYPFEAELAQTPQLAAAQVTIVMYKEFGSGLAEQLGRPFLYAPYGMRETTAFVRELGQLLGTSEQAEAFIAHEKKTTLQAVWDLWRGPQGDWFGTSDVAIVAGRSHAEGLARYLGDELGMKLAFVASRPLRPGDLDNEGVRQVLHKRAPAFLFGSVNERIYLAEAGARFTTFFPAAFPGAAVRRSLGTPFLGYSGAVYLIQEIMNALYNVLFNFLPVDAAYGAARPGAAPPPPPEAAGNMPWQAEARTLLDSALERLPYIPRISASRQLQMQVEAIARERGIDEITPELVDEALATSSVRG
ncbi:MAG TPA: chlorophyllide a reductase subunit Z [Roseiflexaceae bacterium]|nr:chlorophyllide a reductase subunit Z [Roseiflexaceae bacterium]